MHNFGTITRTNGHVGLRDRQWMHVHDARRNCGGDVRCYEYLCVIGRKKWKGRRPFHTMNSGSTIRSGDAPLARTRSRLAAGCFSLVFLFFFVQALFCLGIDIFGKLRQFFVGFFFFLEGFFQQRYMLVFA